MGQGLDKEAVHHIIAKKSSFSPRPITPITTITRRASGRIPTLHSTSCWQHATNAAGSWTSSLRKSVQPEARREIMALYARKHSLCWWIDKRTLENLGTDGATSRKLLHQEYSTCQFRTTFHHGNWFSTWIHQWQIVPHRKGLFIASLQMSKIWGC